VENAMRFVISILIFISLAVTPAWPAEAVKIFAAASLKDALEEVGAVWKAASGKEITVVAAASSALAKQIEEGAPADVFISADLKWMDEVQSKNLTRPETRKNLFGNTLVLVGSEAAPSAIDLKDAPAFAKLLEGQKLATANVDAVPAGRYAKEALGNLGLWTIAEPNLAQSENVRATLALVSRGEAIAGIVYGSDMTKEKHAKIIATFPEDSHAPIVYPIAVVAASANPDATEFAKFLSTPDASKLFLSNGFTVIE
jgi:molybdate transport system substrate-binding protein